MVLDYSKYLGAGGLNPLDSVVKGIGQGQAIRGNELAMQQQQQNMDMQRRIQEQAMAQRQQQQEMLVKQQQDLVNFVNKPNKTYEDYANYAALNPSMQKSIVENFEFRSKAQQENLKRQGSVIYASLQNKKPEIAKRTLENLLNSAEQRGDQQSVAAFDAILESIDVDPNYALSMMGNFLNAVDPENFAKNLETMTDIRQSQEMQPFEKKAKILENKKKLADIGLTKQQQNKVLAETRKLGAEIQNIAVNMEIAKSQNNGVLPPKEKNKAEADLRKEFTSITKNNRDIQNSKNRVDAILSKLDTGAELGIADIAATVAFFKAIDPGSTVTATESGQIEGAEGVMGSIASIFNKITNEGKYTAPMREALKRLVNQIYEPARKEALSLEKKYNKISKDYGLDPNNVIVFDFDQTTQEEENKPLPKQKPPQDETDPEKLLQFYIR
jgi:hypothetical protein